MEELVASMQHNVHVGRQGYDISNLQDQLSKTLAYSNSYHFANQIPFDATSSEPRQAFGSDMRFPIGHTTKPTRPMITPTASFRGGGPGAVATHHAWTTDEPGFTETRQESQQGTLGTNLISGHRSDCEMKATEEHPTKTDDYSAFEHDAFAPLYATSNPTKQFNSVAADPWSAFRSRLPSAIDDANIQRDERSWLQNTNQQPNTWQNQGYAASAYQKH